MPKRGKSKMVRFVSSKDTGCFYVRRISGDPEVEAKLKGTGLMMYDWKERKHVLFNLKKIK